jgi:hypothetical protein
VPSVSLISYLPRVLEVPTRKPTIGTLGYGRVSRSKAGSEDFTAQGPFYELHSLFRGRQAEALSTIGPKRGVNRMHG